VSERDHRTTGSPAERLDSWKEIARYLKRDESTVQRWEKREGMPVHRHLHDKRGSVYAFTAELDAWWQGRRQKLEPGSPRHAEQLRQPEAPRTTDPTRDWWFGTAVAIAILALGFGVIRSLPLLSSSDKSANPELVRLTSSSGLNIDPALSPDGSFMAYASDRDGGDDLDIYVQSTEDEKPRQITNQPGDESEPSFSPDGASIVFVKPEGGGIYVVRASGGEPRLLASVSRAHSPRFSPDGRWITFWTGIPSWVIVTPGATGGVFVVPAEGGSPRPLVPDFVDARHPLWSPDGKKILFLGQTTREVALATLD
jgi:Tol biopolymer transport system component